MSDRSHHTQPARMQFRLKAASGPQTGQNFPLEDEDTSIGSADDADIRLDGLMERHARIVYDGETLMLEPAGKAWVNGEPVQRRPLKSGDEIRLGEYRFGGLDCTCRPVGGCTGRCNAEQGFLGS